MDLPFNTIAGHPLAPDLVYVGTDTGVMVTWDGGQSFTAYGIPAPVFSLAFNQVSTTLVIGTYGRSVFTVPLTATIGVNPTSIDFGTVSVGTIAPAQMLQLYDVDPTGSILNATSRRRLYRGSRSAARSHHWPAR